MKVLITYQDTGKDEFIDCDFLPIEGDNIYKSTGEMYIVAGSSHSLVDGKLTTQLFVDLQEQ